jgi:hypothetical protein
MNKNLFTIDFNSGLKPEEMLQRLQKEFPEARWHGSDTDTQGPTLSSLAKGKPQLKVYFEDDKDTFCINFGSLSLAASELESYKANFVAYIEQQVIPMISVRNREAALVRG